MQTTIAFIAHIPSQTITPFSTQSNQCLDWQTSAIEPTAELYQSFGVDASSFAPLTNDWLYGYGPGDGSSSGGEGDSALDLTFGGENGINGGVGDLSLELDWSLPDLSTVQSTPVMGGEVSPASLDDLLPTGDPALLFNPLPDLTISSAPSLPTSETEQHVSMSPHSINFDLPHQPTLGKRRSPPVDHVTALKRQRNNIAARKYRQKRIDRISELELELDEVRQERDDLKIRLARQEAETAALKTMLQMKSGSRSSSGSGSGSE
ncbi:hypothetical protein GGS20DRAFT_586585 [Poronia punctata]|nr:hypothetical protein GGS20DRAFT_586585 [Poronia punctata]